MGTCWALKYGQKHRRRLIHTYREISIFSEVFDSLGPPFPCLGLTFFRHWQQRRGHSYEVSVIGFGI